MRDADGVLGAARRVVGQSADSVLAIPRSVARQTENVAHCIVVQVGALVMSFDRSIRVISSWKTRVPVRRQKG